MFRHLLLILTALALSLGASAKKRKRVLKKKAVQEQKLGTVEPPADPSKFFQGWLYARKSEALSKVKDLRKEKLRAKIVEIQTSINPTALIRKSFTSKEKAEEFGKQFKGLYTGVVRYKGQYWTSFGQFYEYKTLEERKKHLYDKNIRGLKTIVLPRRRVTAYQVMVEQSQVMDGFFARTKKVVNDAKASGFYLLEAAYGTEDPSHWSKFKNWFFGNLEGTRESFRWKLSGRFFYDMAFDLESELYSSFVKKNHQSQFIFDESFVDFTWKDWDFRLGRQHIVWGDLIGAYVADVVSARDLRDFILPRKSIRRIPQWAFMSEKHWTKSYFQVFALPLVNVDEIGVYGSDFFPLVISDFNGFTVEELGREAPDFGNVGFGGKFAYRTENYNWGLFYLSSVNREARYERTISGTNVKLRAKHFDVQKTGITIDREFEEYVLRFESALALNDKAPIDDATDTDGLVDQKVFDFALALDANWFDNSQTLLQYVARTYLDYEEKLLVDENEQFVTVYGNYKFDDADWLAELTLHFGVQRQDTLVRPRFNWTINPEIELAFGYDMFNGDENGLFGRFKNNDRVYTEFLWNF